MTIRRYLARAVLIEAIIALFACCPALHAQYPVLENMRRIWRERE